MRLFRLISILILLLPLAACASDTTPIPPPATATAPPATLSAPPTSAPPTLTAMPPTEAQPTFVGPTVAPTTLPPTAVALTEVPPTAVPPTSAPATTAPPTALPPTVATTSAPRAAVPPPAPSRVAPTIAPTHNPKLIAIGEGNPDDLVVAPDGTIYFGDFANNAINRIAPGGGKPEPVVSGLLEPEGMVIAPDGKLIVAEQKTNRILEIDLATRSKLLLRQLVNTTGQDGVDGLALDPRTGEILVPDSPNGRLLAMSRDGSQLRTIATGFTRPTGVAVLRDGDLLVADEFGNALYRVTRAGHKTVLASMFQPDDVVVAHTDMAYVNTLGGTIYRVDPGNGARTTLLTGLKLPHGIGLGPQGQVVIAEAGRNRIFSIDP